MEQIKQQMFPLFSHAMQTQLRFRISQQIVTEIYDQIFTLIYPDFKIKFFEAKREVKAVYCNPLIKLYLMKLPLTP